MYFCFKPDTLEFIDNALSFELKDIVATIQAESIDDIEIKPNPYKADILNLPFGVFLWECIECEMTDLFSE